MKISDNPYYLSTFPDKVLSKDSSCTFIEAGDAVKIENNAKALTAFICTVGLKKDVHIFTPDGDAVLNTFGIFVDRCRDQEFMEELRETLVPMQRELMEKMGFPEFSCCGLHKNSTPVNANR